KGQQWRKETERIERRLAEVKKVLGSELSRLLDTVTELLCRWVVFPTIDHAHLISLWISHTWCLDAADYTPGLNVFSATKRSGKSRVLELLELFCRNAELIQSGSSAALIRSIDPKNPPTFLLDEVDVIFSKKNDAEAQNFRGLINA